MEKDKIRVAIIGLGGVGSRVKKAFLEHSATEVISVCDLDSSIVSSHTSDQGIVGYTDYRAMLKQEQLDLVYVAVPPKYHHAIVLDILKSRKHILCEKPLANSLQEAEAMLAAALESGVVHAMNFPTYYRPACKEMKRFLKEGRLGDVRRVEIKLHFPEWPRTWQQNNWISTREQGGFTREVIPHFLQIIQRLFGPVGRVSSSLEYPEDSTACEIGILANIELVANKNISVLVNGLSHAAVQEETSLTIYGSKGRVSLKNWGGLFFGNEGGEWMDIPLQSENHLHEMVDNVVKAIWNQENDIIDFDEGTRVQRTLDLLLQSAAELKRH